MQPAEKEIKISKNSVPSIESLMLGIVMHESEAKLDKSRWRQDNLSLVQILYNTW